MKKERTRRRRGFTLLEVIIAVTSFFLLLVVIINIYAKMMKLKYNIQARTNITQDSYLAIEKINLLLKDYTIDYEEYFNRKNIGCDNYNDNFSRDIGTNGYCDIFTAYGNNSKIYFCSSKTDETNPYVIKNPDVQNGS